MSDKEREAIKRLQLAAKMSERYYKKPLLICYSGGKDSEVILELAKRAEIPFEVQHSHTTADAPETVYHVRETFKRLENGGGESRYYKADLFRTANINVDADTQKKYAAYTHSKILLCGA